MMPDVLWAAQGGGGAMKDEATSTVFSQVLSK